VSDEVNLREAREDDLPRLPPVISLPTAIAMLMTRRAWGRRSAW
jgi:hypothetical protein